MSDGDIYLHQSLPDLPAEDAGVVLLVLLDLVLHLRRGHPRLAPSDHTRPDAARLLIPAAPESPVSSKSSSASSHLLSILETQP